jgi:hypothetical protein
MDDVREEVLVLREGTWRSRQQGGIQDGAQVSIWTAVWKKVLITSVGNVLCVWRDPGDEEGHGKQQILEGLGFRCMGGTKLDYAVGWGLAHQVSHSVRENAWKAMSHCPWGTGRFKVACGRGRKRRKRNT